ncbi:MAG: hypothetical protein F6J90_38010 [Moorea sp. SIOASIH]|uniref:hypothetical protein n=1 Tax=Moorena sp. SIOASIH TaxID=2607817 RepID=UPI0013B6FEF3|nr:hypothetical protein [Moorena sp. SIOASIH]NEO41812.1 hypothetical protein [Moorena sp. SIOASIH]
MILRLGARLLGRVNRPWVAPVEWASGVEQASCLLKFPGGQDAHSTPIHSKTDATPELWLIANKREYNCVVIIFSES